MTIGLCPLKPLLAFTYTGTSESLATLPMVFETLNASKICQNAGSAVKSTGYSCR